MKGNQLFISNLEASRQIFEYLKALSYEHLPRQLIFKKGPIKLYHYKNPNATCTGCPLLIVFSTINRPDILELTKENSFIANLLKQGIEVYLLDWGEPSADDYEISISDYVLDYLDHGVKAVLATTKQKQINLLGICQGGTLCACYAAISRTVKNLVLISTPIDFHTKDDLIAKIIKHINVGPLVQNKQNIPGLWFTHFFISMRPFELIGKKYLRFIDHLSNKKLTERFLRVERWLYDVPDQTAFSFGELVKDFYQANKLIKGEIYLYGRRVDLTKLDVPIFNIMARHDVIVPMSATRALKDLVSNRNYHEKIFKSGHIGIYISEKVGDRLPSAIAKWLKIHS
jgi:polyhydroxyalkanoate synthase